MDSGGRGKLVIRMDAVAPGDVREIQPVPLKGARIERRKFVERQGMEPVDQVLVYGEDEALLFVGSVTQFQALQRVLSVGTTSAEG